MAPYAEPQSRDQFTLILNSGQVDDIDCVGTYIRHSHGKVRDRSIYHNAEKNMIIFFNGISWTLAPSERYAGVLDGATGGHYFSESSTCDPDMISWSPRYTVG